MVQKTNYFCETAQFTPFVPEEFRHRTEEDWIALSKAGEFVPVFRFGAGVFWRKSAVLGWAIRRFGKTHPESISAMNEAGFVMPE